MKKNCLICKGQVYKSRTSPEALCTFHSSKPPLPARNFPVLLNEYHPDYHFSIPPRCDLFEPVFGVKIDEKIV